MIRLFENELTALYLDLTKKYWGNSYCTSQELIDFKNIIMDLSKENNIPLAIFGDQGSSAWYYFDGVNVSVLPTAQDIVRNSLVRSYEALSSIKDTGILEQAFLQTMKKELEREEEELHAKKLKYMQLSYEKQNQLKK